MLSLLLFVPFVFSANVPVLADGFSSTIEAVIDNKNYTLILKEVYDFDNDRLRVDRASRDGRVIEICDIKHKNHVVVTKNSSGMFCKKSPVETCRLLRGAGHLSRASQMLEMIDNVTYTDEGEDVARGIRCNKWKSSVQSMTSRRRPAIQINFTMEWYFQRGDWNHGAAHGRAIPVLALLVGNDINVTSGELTPFKHHYNFLDYHPIYSQEAIGHDDDHFDFKPEWGCSTDETTSSTAPGDDGTSSPPSSLTCGEGATEQDGKCVCTSDDTQKVSEGRSLLGHVGEVASAYSSFVPGFVAGFFFH